MLFGLSNNESISVKSIDRKGIQEYHISICLKRGDGYQELLTDLNTFFKKNDLNIVCSFLFGQNPLFQKLLQILNKNGKSPLYPFGEVHL